MNSKKHILILGAGFGGLSTALEFKKLRSKYPENDFDVTIVDRNSFQLFTPDLYEIAAAIKPETTEEDLKNAVCLDVKLALWHQQVKYVQAEVQKIDTANKQVNIHHVVDNGTTKVVGEKDTLAYDVLLIALGSENFTFGIEGMEKHSIALKRIEEAAAIRNKVFDLVKEDGPDHVIICGGGPAGVELAAELALSCKRQMLEHLFTITMVEGKPRVLESFGDKVANKAMKRLSKLGVSLETNFMIAKAEKGKITSTEGKTIEGDLIVWTGGVKANSLLSTTDIELTKRGQLPVERTMQTTQRPEVFAIGDNAQIPKKAPKSGNPEDQEYCAQTAHEAVSQAPITAHNIMRYLAQQELRPYHPNELAEAYVIATGGKKAIVKLPMGIVFTSYFGWVARKIIDFNHFKKVLPFMHACSVWYNGIKTMTRNEK